MGRFIKGDIVVMPFPFSDLSSNKKRPAIVLADLKDQEAVSRIQHTSHINKEKRVLEYPQLLKTPIVRNGKQTTIGYKPEVWKEWT